MSRLSDLAALASLSKEAIASESKSGYVLGETLVVTNLGYWSEAPSKKGGKPSPSKFYGTLEGYGLIRLQGDDADLWLEGLTEATKELGLPGVEWLEGEMTSSVYKGARWEFDVEPAYVGKVAELKEWDDGEAYHLHGGMLAGPLTIHIRRHKPPRKAWYESIRLEPEDE